MYGDEQPLECRELGAEWKQPLVEFLRALEEAGDAEYFCPHAFTDDTVENLIQRRQRDLYYVLVERKKVLGYGMLRGWDEGYDIPSLGIAIHPSARGAGLGRVLMHFLHASARREGAKKVRLRVKANNARAVKLYEDLGYKFKSLETDYLVGFFDLYRQDI